MTKKNHETNNKAKNRSIGSTSNTYVQNTSLNSSTIDYLTFRIVNHISIEEVIESLLSLEIDEIGNTYRDENGVYKTYEHYELPIIIKYRRNSIHIELKGKACSELKDDKLQAIIRKAIRLNAQFERIDLFRDDFDRLLDMDEIQELTKGKSLTSRLQKMGFQENYNDYGKTVYFGLRENETYIRIYDKGKQQKVDLHWVRCEIEFKHRAADKVAQQIAESDNIGKVYGGILRSKLNFKIPSGDSLKSRWKTQEWWSAFIGECETVKIGRRHEVNQDRDKLQWVLSHYSRTIYELNLTMGNGLYKMILEEGKRRSERKRGK